MMGVGAAIVLIPGGTTVGMEMFDGFLRFGLIVGFPFGVGFFLSIRSPVLGMMSLSSGRFLGGDRRGGNFAATQASEKPQVESSFDPSGLIVSKRTIRSCWNISQSAHSMNN